MHKTPGKCPKCNRTWWCYDRGTKITLSGRIHVHQCGYCDEIIHLDKYGNLVSH